jgi:hypothetical protein
MKQAWIGAVALACAMPQAMAAAGAPVAAAEQVEARAAYQAALARAKAVWQQARAQCNTITGNPKAVCMAEARAVRVGVEEEARARYKNTVKAYTQSRLRIATANFELGKARCAALTGNEKDVCLKQAKAALVAAQADAKADRKAIEARADARDDKREALYKVALEKCDAFAGVARDDCVKAAKSQYGK